MSIGLIIAGWVLAAIAATTLVWRRRRDQSARFVWARASGLDVYKSRSHELIHAFRDLTLMQIGHSRRIDAAFILPQKARAEATGVAFCYRCQTGFDQERYVHVWLVAAVEIPGRVDRAVITSQDWLQAAAYSPSCRVLPIVPTEADFAAASPSGGVSNRDNPPLPPGKPSDQKLAIVEDAEAWKRRLRGELGRLLQNQPAERSWEMIAGWIVGYETGAAEGPPLLALATATQEFAALLAGEE